MNRIYLAYHVPVNFITHTVNRGHQLSLLLAPTDQFHDDAWMYKVIPKGLFSEPETYHGVYEESRIPFRTTGESGLLALVILGETDKTGEDLDAMFADIPVPGGELFVEDWTLAAIMFLMKKRVVWPTLSLEELLSLGSSNADRFLDGNSPQERKQRHVITIDDSGKIVAL